MATAEQEVRAYLDGHNRKDLLRFLTCGSVDDGKSTLIGRLLHDSFVKGGVKGFSEGFHRLHVISFEHFSDFIERHFKPFDHAGIPLPVVFALLLGCVQCPLQIVHHAEQILDQAFIGIFAVIFCLPLHALFVIFKLCRQAQQTLVGLGRLLAGIGYFSL